MSAAATSLNDANEAYRILTKQNRHELKIWLQLSYLGNYRNSLKILVLNIFYFIERLKNFTFSEVWLRQWC